MQKLERLILPILYNLKKILKKTILCGTEQRVCFVRSTDSPILRLQEMSNKDEIIKKLRDTWASLSMRLLVETPSCKVALSQANDRHQVESSQDLLDGNEMQRILDDESAEGRKKQKQMANLVIGREENNKEISLEFKTAASRERFRKMMNESVELDEMKKSDGPFTVVAIKNNKVVGQLRNVEHNDIEVAIDMMRKDKQGAKISVESKKGKVVHTEEVELDESVKIMFKGFGKEVTEFQQKLKKFGQAADYRIMMQNLKNHSNVGDGLYFTETSKGLGFEIHSVRDRMMVIRSGNSVTHKTWVV